MGSRSEFNLGHDVQISKDVAQCRLCIHSAVALKRKSIMCILTSKDEEGISSS